MKRDRGKNGNTPHDDSEITGDAKILREKVKKN